MSMVKFKKKWSISLKYTCQNECGYNTKYEMMVDFV